MAVDPDGDSYTGFLYGMDRALMAMDLQRQVLKTQKSLAREPRRNREDDSELPFETGEYGGIGGSEFFGTETGVEKTPVILSHGLGRDARTFEELFDHLLQEGYRGDEIYSITYSDFLPTMEKGSRELSKFTDSVLEYTDSESVNLVGHSMGGNIARKAAQESEDGNINSVWALSSPATGSSYVDLLEAFGLPSMEEISLESARTGALSELNSGEQDSPLYTLSGSYDAAYPVNTDSPVVEDALNLEIRGGHDDTKDSDLAARIIAEGLESQDQDDFLERIPDELLVD
ncbi:MAG: esterase/lipase family protein [Candidatus Nanosalina sp.]